jgi:hypothetical protein
MISMASETTSFMRELNAKLNSIFTGNKAVPPRFFLSA